MKLLVLLGLLTTALGQKEPHTWPGRTAMVHLFEWKFADVAAECENFLAPMGYAGVQLSPVGEYRIIDSPPRPWWERYQPVSYIIASRSGSESDFLDMTTRCNRVGIRIYVDVVPNHMTGSGSGVGTAGNTFNADIKDYPGVPYVSSHFHATCQINNFDDPVEVRICELLGLKDLDQGQGYVKDKIVAFLDRLVELGAAGFRVDAAKHMWPGELRAIYESVSNLNTEFGFPAGSRPFFYQEVIDKNPGSGAVSIFEYTDFARVTDFKYGSDLSYTFGGNQPLSALETFGPIWNLIPGGDSLVFIDNHDNQRGHGDGGDILTYKDGRRYKMAVAFMLSWPQGYPRVMSSFAFTDPDQGPPADGSGNILGPNVQPDGTCGNGWVCEHRWRQIYNMIGFSNAVAGTAVSDWFGEGDHIAYCRGGQGFIAFNNGGGDFQRPLQTCLSAGVYCDVISGSLVGGACTGKSVTVAGDGMADIEILSSEDDGILAIHHESKT